MAWTSGFFNSDNGDRPYSADQISEMFEGLVSNGVFESVGKKLAVEPNDGMTIQINTGRGKFGKRWVKNDSIYVIQLDESDVILNRYAAVCVRVDNTDSGRTALPYVKYSEFATSPTKPTMERTETIEEYCLGMVLIRGGTNEITAADIEDTRPNTELCGWVTGLIEQLDSDTLWTQWEALFLAWFDRMKDQLDEDAAGNLQTQVDEVRQTANNAMPKTGGAFTNYVDILPGVPFDIKAKNGNRLRLLGDTESNNAYIHILKADGSFVTDILVVNTETGEVTSNTLLPKSGGYMTGTMYARTDGRNIPFNTGEVMNIGVRTSDGSQAVKSSFILMQRK